MRILKCGPIFHDRNDSALFLKPSVRKDVILGMEKNRVRLQIAARIIMSPQRTMWNTHSPSAPSWTKQSAA